MKKRAFLLGTIATMAMTAAPADAPDLRSLDRWLFPLP